MIRVSNGSIRIVKRRSISSWSTTLCHLSLQRCSRVIAKLSIMGSLSNYWDPVTKLQMLTRMVIQLSRPQYLLIFYNIIKSHREWTLIPTSWTPQTSTKLSFSTKSRTHTASLLSPIMTCTRAMLGTSCLGWLTCRTTVVSSLLHATLSQGLKQTGWARMQWRRFGAVDHAALWCTRLVTCLASSIAHTMSAPWMVQTGLLSTLSTQIVRSAPSV